MQRGVPIRTTVAFLVFLAFLPLASAGPGASVSTLESQEGCTGSYEWNSTGWNDNWSWYYSYYGYSTSSCTDSFEYAGAEAHDDDGEIASASVGGEQGNESASSWNGYDVGSPDGYAYGDSSTWSYASGWSRGASVDTRAGSVNASDMCQSGAVFADQSYSSSYGAYQESSQRSSRSEASRCGLEAASDAGGVPADAFAGESCANSEDTWSTSRSQPSWNASMEYGSSSSGCLRGARAAAVGESASAGAGNACEASYSSYGSASGTSHQDQDARCRNGIFASGPDGMTLFIGYEESSWGWCSGNVCEGDASQSIGASLDWQHSPLGPNGNQIWYTLPLP